MRLFGWPSSAPWSTAALVPRLSPAPLSQPAALIFCLKGPVDALGELADIDGADVWWDTANPVPALGGISGGQVLPLPGGVTGFGDWWASPGWRAVRATDQVDRWAVIGAPFISGARPGAEGPVGVLSAGIGLAGGGGLEVAGLEWPGARAYDPSVCGFLSTDPLAPFLGGRVGWQSVRLCGQ